MREDFAGFGGKAGDGEAIGDVIPKPWLESGRVGDLAAGDDARRLAERIAASSSFLVGSWICEGLPVAAYVFFLPQTDAASLTEGELMSVFSLSSSAALAGWRPKRDPKPLNSGISSLGVVVDFSEGERFDRESGLTAGVGLL